ncbi:divergent polysaccharide deacetylase family protein [Shimia sp. SDUM112013]|uniref:divergent polysaccharide deacetylase family protein n=1 Tax=Shimia sp. SDUM112013 TaxID=3136160 RepID=UPI0032EEB382
MIRGLISGVFWGAVTIALVLGLASLLAPLPATVAPQTDATEPAGVTPPADGTPVAGGSQVDTTVPETGTPPVTSTGDGDQPPLTDTASAPKPDVAAPDGTMTAPEPGSAASGLSGDSTSDPALPGAMTEAPAAPSTDDDLSITTNPAQPVAPSVPVVEGAFETPAPAPEQDMSPDAESGETEDMATEMSEGESMLKPAGNLDEKFPQLESSRLPTVTGDATPVETTRTPRPFDLNAEPFEIEPGKPIMSVVLLDDGSSEIDVEILTSFPYPLSFAVNTLVPDLVERVATYRNLGFEVLAMVDLPAAAAASDVEVALDAHLSAMPEAIGVMEGTGDGLQGSKEVSDQTRAVLLNSGHGLVMFPKGLNTAQKLASRDGVPAATVFRDFDGKGQNATVIRRFLDQAAFKAGQEGGVVMVGRLREETISALLLWGLQDRASTVSLAPVSALLRSKEL